MYNIFTKRFIHLNLQILYQCNFRCGICDFWKHDYLDRKMMSAEDAGFIANRLKPEGPLIVSIGGGEPMMHPQIIPIIKNLSVHHFPVMICNGWFINDENAKELFEAGLYEISISVDYADSFLHNKQRGKKGAFDKAITALETLARNRKYSHQRIHMISVVMEDNLMHIEELIRLAKKIGITYVVTLYSNSRGNKADKKTTVEASHHLLSLKKKYPEFVALRGYVSRFSEASENGIFPCFAGKNLMNIDCEGNVSRCIDRLDDTAGNIFNDDWNIIKKNLIYQYQNNQCGDCWTSCRGNIETLLYGKNKIKNFIDSHTITKDIALHGS